MPDTFIGAFAYMFVPASSLDQALQRVKNNTEEDKYEIRSIKSIIELNLDRVESSNNEEAYPSKEDLLKAIKDNYSFYGQFYCYSELDDN
ncbi:hypothetical protein KCM76_25330 [Zooshikella marina]|uniref:hypothetical protein n=1 Tax=Zooshikella ganghwensis TaxID=202772 RepID=UPI001BAEE6E0|nr:hypothetical protein [Zooshikella ganghwensis]MBU2709343.1 hypothetical protein [Zooshikella ganghwensis]